MTTPWQRVWDLERALRDAQAKLDEARRATRDAEAEKAKARKILDELRQIADDIERKFREATRKWKAGDGPWDDTQTWFNVWHFWWWFIYQWWWKVYEAARAEWERALRDEQAEQDKYLDILKELREAERRAEEWERLKRELKLAGCCDVHFDAGLVKAGALSDRVEALSASDPSWREQIEAAVEAYRAEFG